MMDFSDEEEARHEFAGLYQKAIAKAVTFTTTDPAWNAPFLLNDGKAYHGMSRLLADIRKPEIPDFRGAGWLWG